MRRQQSACIAVESSTTSPIGRTLLIRAPSLGLVGLYQVVAIWDSQEHPGSGVAAVVEVGTEGEPST